MPRSARSCRDPCHAHNVLRLMADYEGHPLWEVVGPPRNIDPFVLAIPDDLARALTDWADEFTATLDRDDPPASGFPDVPAREAWERRGAELADALRGQGFEVEYGQAWDPQEEA